MQFHCDSSNSSVEKNKGRNSPLNKLNLLFIAFRFHFACRFSSWYRAGHSKQAEIIKRQILLKRKEIALTFMKSKKKSAQSKWSKDNYKKKKINPKIQDVCERFR